MAARARAPAKKATMGLVLAAAPVNSGGGVEVWVGGGGIMVPTDRWAVTDVGMTGGVPGG